MSSNVVIGVIALDRAMIWRNGIDPKTQAEHLSAFKDNAEYRDEREERASGRDRSVMDDDFLNDLVPYFSGAEHIILISAGTGKSNAGEAFVAFLEKKQPDTAKKIIELLSADVNKLTENELLKLGRERWESYLATDI